MSQINADEMFPLLCAKVKSAQQLLLDLGVRHAKRRHRTLLVIAATDKNKKMGDSPRLDKTNEEAGSEEVILCSCL